MATLAMPRTTTRFGGLRIAIGVLVGLTALVHLAIGAFTTLIVTTDPTRTASMGGATALNVMAALFYLCGVGYVGLAVALYLPALRRLRRLTRTALIVFTRRYHPRVFRPGICAHRCLRPRGQGV